MTSPNSTPLCNVCVAAALFIVSISSTISISAYIPHSSNNINNPRIIRQTTSSDKKLVVQPPQYSVPSNNNNPYIRIQKRGQNYNIQTAITTFQKIDTNNSDDDSNSKTTVDLHAQIHFGDASYFDYFNNEASLGEYDKVLYELIVEDKFLNNCKQLIPASPNSKLNPIMPSQADRNTANQYGLICQIDGIEYCKEHWVHADVTREEFISYLEQGDEKQPAQQQQLDNKQPLWALASTAATYPGSELVSSLLRPYLSTTTSNSAQLTRRLFTHLFLPGDALSGWIRAILWLGVPSPELSIMLVDWSSLSYIGRQKSRRRGSSTKQQGGGDDGDTNNISPISPIAAPVFISLLTGNWGVARRLVFGQVLVAGQSNSDTSKSGILIEKRNDRAMDVLCESLSSLDDNGNDNRIALLYGAGHCRDLHNRLVQEENMTPIRTEWRTAFRATAPRWGDFVNTDDWRAKSKDIASSFNGGRDIAKAMTQATLESVSVGLVILPLYLLVGGLDWLSTIGDLGNALDSGSYVDGMADVLLYLVRHVALYVGISKFVVDWGGNDGVFELDE